MRLVLISLIILTTPTKASETDCLAKVMYAEARGESLEGVVAVGHATVNRGNPCAVTGVHRKQPPKNMLEYYKALAKEILNAKHDPVKGANSWNTGEKPAYRGDVTRQIGSHVFYVLKPPME